MYSRLEIAARRKEEELNIKKKVKATSVEKVTKSREREAIICTSICIYYNGSQCL